MRNQVFVAWDEVGCEIDEFTLPAVNQGMLDALPATTPPRVILDLADVWRAEEVKNEIGHERVHMTLSNGTHLLVALFGRDKKYAIGWHPTDQDAQRDAMTAAMYGVHGGDVDEEDEEEAKLADLIREIAQKYEAETTFG